MKAAVCAALATVALGAAAGVGQASATETPYSRAPSTRCLRSHGVESSKIRPIDASRSSLADLAQHTSLEVRTSRASVLLAFTPSPSQADLLVELLTMPSNRYKLQVRRNVLLMFRAQDRKLADLVTACLRT
jgi:hypothetical protein